VRAARTDALKLTRMEHSHGFVVSFRMAGSDSGTNIRHKAASLDRKTGADSQREAAPHIK
jgi:hypothetical protein